MPPPKYISTDPNAGSPVGNYLSTDPNAGSPAGQPIQDSATIGPQQRAGIGEQIASFARPIVGPIANTTVGMLPFLGKYLQTNPNPAPGTVASDVENYTQQGRAQHPFLAKIGDIMRGLHSENPITGGGQSTGLLDVVPREAAFLDIPGAVGGVGQTTQAALEARRGTLPFLRSTVGDQLRDPVTGKLRPVVREGARALGASVGYEQGKESGHGMEGMLVGGIFGPGLADAMIPNSQSAIYEQAAKDLMTRQRQQDAIDRQASRAITVGGGTGPTGSAAEPFEPLVYSSPEEAAAQDQRMKNLQRQAKAAGTYHAAQGAAGRRLNLQQRIERTYEK